MRAMTEIEWLDGRVTKVPELALGDALGESVQAELDFGFDDVLEGLWVEVRHHEPDEDSDGGPRPLGRGELQLDLRPEFREDAHRRRLSPHALLQAGHAGVLGPLDLLPGHLVAHRHDGLPLALVLPHAAGSAYA